MKNLTNSQENNNFQNAMLRFKLEGYQQKSVSANRSIAHDDLKWLKIEGYQPSAKKNSAFIKAASMMPATLNLTMYQQMEILKAKRQFFFGTMTMMVLLNLLYLAARFVF